MEDAIRFCAKNIGNTSISYRQGPQLPVDYINRTGYIEWKSFFLSFPNFLVGVYIYRVLLRVKTDRSYSLSLECLYRLFAKCGSRLLVNLWTCLWGERASETQQVAFPSNLSDRKGHVRQRGGNWV